MIMGFNSDHTSIRGASFVPLICQSYVLYFALSGYTPVAVGPVRQVPELSTAQ